MPANNIWKDIKFVTSNLNKIREVETILDVTLDHVSLDIDEIQTTDVDCAVLHKAKEAYRIVQSPVLVEDSGLVFNAWEELPGAMVKWFEKSVGLEGMIKMLHEFQDKDAVAICSAAAYDGKEMISSRGEVFGRILEEPQGENGFGWDRIFVPDGYTKTFAEMTAAEKNLLSHRRKAFLALRERVTFC